MSEVKGTPVVISLRFPDVRGVFVLEPGAKLESLYEHERWLGMLFWVTRQVTGGVFQEISLALDPQCQGTA